jgi:single-stranded-DNA-specific exonuclease
MASVEVAEKLKRLEPFGSGNPEPLFGFENLEVQGVQTMGKNQQHLKVVFCDCDNKNKKCEAVFWGKAQLGETIKVGKTISVAGRLEVNEWKGKKKIQLVGKDVLIDN